MNRSTTLPAGVCAMLMLLATATGTRARQYPVLADVPDMEMAYPILTVDFSDHLRPWDGFGVNYVEVTQTRDYGAFEQDHGGYGVLTEEARSQIIDLVFGEDGLRPGVTKIFLDPWHEGTRSDDNDNDDPRVIDPEGFDHARTTRWVREFNRRGLETTRARGGDLQMITTLYGPPPWMTLQRVVNGRDLDPAMQEELAEYLVSWVRYLREEEGLPVRYLSLHNEGDAYYRWPPDGSTPGEVWEDYNLYWDPMQVVELIKRTRRMLDRHGQHDVGMTPGETQTWYRFDVWGYAGAIEDDARALADLALVTGHSFANYDLMGSRFYGDWRSTGTDLLRAARPDLHAWTTSQPWNDMDARLIDDMRRNVYVAKCNAVIPWAIMHRPGQWITEGGGRTTRARAAFRVNEDGTFDILPGYWYYKQATRAGQPGMAVAEVSTLDPAVGVMAFASNRTDHPDAFVLINTSGEEKQTTIRVRGTVARVFDAVRTAPSGERFSPIGLHEVVDGDMRYTAPPGSVTTFFAR